MVCVLMFLSKKNQNKNKVHVTLSFKIDTIELGYTCPVRANDKPVAIGFPAVLLPYSPWKEPHLACFQLPSQTTLMHHKMQAKEIFLLQMISHLREKYKCISVFVLHVYSQ